MTVLLLGPGRDEAGNDEPLLERLELARRMRATGTGAVVMEEEADVEGENNFAKFRRLIQERGVTTYLLVVPLKSRLHGLSVEIGHLLTEIQERRLPATHVHVVFSAKPRSIEKTTIKPARPGHWRWMGCPWTSRVYSLIR